jgi:hypothetical protein
MARQYNLKDFNGVYLKTSYNFQSFHDYGTSALIKNSDFFPLRDADITDFEFLSASYKSVLDTSIYYGQIVGNGFRGDNSYSTKTSEFNYSQIKKNNELVKGEIYYTNFNLYFNFNGDAYGYNYNEANFKIAVSVYALLGSNKIKLKLSNLQVYDYTTYGATDNPDSANYVNISTSFFSNHMDLTNDNINIKYLPQPKDYSVENTGGTTTTLTYIEGATGYSNYGASKTITVSAGYSYLVTSFSIPTETGFGLNQLKIVDSGYNINEKSPFSTMTGPMFRVTAELDASTKELFESNICKNNKEFKIIVDYNDTISQTVSFLDPTNFDTISGGSGGTIGPPMAFC